jgi:hypothetical protein
MFKAGGDSKIRHGRTFMDKKVDLTQGIITGQTGKSTGGNVY